MNTCAVQTMALSHTTGWVGVCLYPVRLLYSSTMHRNLLISLCVTTGREHLLSGIVNTSFTRNERFSSPLGPITDDIYIKYLVWWWFRKTKQSCSSLVVSVKSQDDKCSKNTRQKKAKCSLRGCHAFLPFSLTLLFLVNRWRSIAFTCEWDPEIRKVNKDMQAWLSTLLGRRVRAYSDHKALNSVCVQEQCFDEQLKSSQWVPRGLCCEN